MGAARVAAFHVENPFARPRAFDTLDWAAGEPVLAAYAEFNYLIAMATCGDLIAMATCGDADRQRMR